MTDRTVPVAKRIELHGGTLAIAGGRSLEIGPEPVVVGRNDGCALVLPDRHVSAVHAELVATERGVRLRDLGSRNGTWIGGFAVVEGYLAEPCTLSFGPVKARFEARAPSRVTMRGGDRFGALYGSNASMRQLFTRLEKAAPTDLTVLVLGETGTGKELVAQAIHATSPRSSRPFVVVDCGAIAPTLAESLLFGHEKGAFTGAVARRESPFVEADGGTVFLDELGELPVEIQPKLLRALAEGRVKSVGSNVYRDFDARIIAATRRDLGGMVNAGAFRSDLYFRIAQVRVEVPPLRARPDDIPGLVRDFLEQCGAPAGAESRIDQETMLRLMRHDWPGNVRELRNAVSVAYALSAGSEPLEIAAHVGLLEGVAAGDAASANVGYHDAKREALARFERGYFALLFQQAGGNIAEISRRAGLQRTHVRRYLVAHGVLPTRGRARHGRE